MRVIVVNDFGHVQGGASDVAINGAIGLANKGVDVVFFSAVTPIDPRLKNAKIQIVVTNQKEILKDASKLKAAFRGMWNADANKAFQKLLMNYRTEDTIIHVHGWTKALSSSPIVKAAGMGYKVVMTLHDYFLSCPNGCLYNHTSRSICKVHPLSLKCIATNCDSRNYQYKLYRVARQLVQNKILRLPQAIKNYIVLSDFSHKILGPLLPPDATIHHVNNPINISRRVPANPETHDQFLYCGRLSKEKGIDVLVQAIQKTRSRLVIVGDGENSISEKLENISILGWMSKEQVVENFYRCRALVFPSVWYEVAPLIVQEAAAHGIPVIVADTSAAKDFVKDNETGLHFKGGDSEDLCRAIKRLAESDELVRLLGVNAFKNYWEQHTSIERHAELLIDVYQKVIRKAI